MDKLGAALAILAQQFGFTANRLWPQIVAVTFWESVAWLLIDLVILIGGGLAMARVLGWAVEGVRKDDEDSSGYMVVGVLIAIAALLVGGLIIATLPDVIAGIVAPEAVAALNVLRAAGGK